jgi:hypothetical protein
MDPQALLFIIVLATGFWLALVVIPQFMIKRAMEQVIRIFRDHGALEVTSAKNLDELGLRPPGMFESIGRARDYKPTALNFLLTAGVIKEAGGQKMFLSERQLQKVCANDPSNRLGLCRTQQERAERLS